MRILFLNHNVGWSNGTFFRAYHFGRHLVNRGHAVTLVTISRNRRWGWEREIREGVELLYSPDLLWGIGRTGWDAWDALWRAAAVGGRRWDVVHAWDSRPVVILPALWALRRGRPRGTRLVLDWCDWWGRGGTQAERVHGWMRPIAPIETWFEEHFRTRADGTTVISRALFERAAALGVAPKSIYLLPQGCDAPTEPTCDRADARARLGIGANEKVVLSIGALQRADAQLLFEAARRVLAERSDSRLFLIGRHRSQVPPDLAQHPRFVETGFVADDVLQDYVTACEALLVPLGDTLASRARWPSKVNPLLAAGRAVVMTRIGDLAALLEEQQAACVVPPSAEALAEGVGKVLADDCARVMYEGRARAVAAETLAWPRLAEQLERFYCSL